MSRASSDPQPINLRRKIYELILDQKERFGCLPTQDDLRRLFGNFSSDVDLHLQQLAREGLLLLDRNGGNGISLVPTYVQLPEIGILGHVAQGFSGQSGCQPRGSIGLDLRGCGVRMEPGTQCVQVLDDRMIDAGIEFGDIALVVNSLPTRGCIVAIEEADVMVLRRYVVLSGIPHFLAENPTAPGISPAWNVNVQGVLWGLIKVESCWRANGAGPSLEGTNSFKASTGKSPSSKPQQVRANPNWPKPLSGHQLNEPRPNSTLVARRKSESANPARSNKPQKSKGRRG